MTRLLVHIERLTSPGSHDRSPIELAAVLKPELDLRLADVPIASWRFSPDRARRRCAPARVEQGAAPQRVGEMAGSAIAQAIAQAASRGGMPGQGSAR